MSTKNRKRRRRYVDVHSISFKVWQSMTLFAVMLLLLLWGLEVFFLNNYYESMKSMDLSRTFQELIHNYKQNKDLNKLEIASTQASRSNDLTIFVTNTEGRNVLDTNDESIFQNPSGHNNYETSIAMLLTRLRSSKLTTITSTIVSDRTRNKILAYAGYLDYSEADADSQGNYVLLIFTPLYPMRSTIAILRSQLIYVSIIAMFLALIIAMFLAARITIPIKRITRSAGQMGSGHYDIEFDGSGLSETHELAVTLTQAEQDLKRIDSYQKDLIANVSHDLRTPLTMIKSYAEMIQDISGDIPEKRDAHLQVIIEETDRLNTLVTDLLNMSRLQSGKIELDRSYFDLREAAESVMSTYLVLNDSEGYHIRLDCKNGNYPIYADESRLKQVMSNLISNAVKYCGEDKQVLVEVLRLGKCIQFSVTDHGRGIKQEELTHVWDRYYKTSTHHVRSTEGSGLGLSIVKEILQLHGARFDVESEYGKGSTFWFELPLSRPPKQNKEKETEPPETDPEN